MMQNMFTSRAQAPLYYRSDRYSHQVFQQYQSEWGTQRLSHPSIDFGEDYAGTSLLQVKNHIISSNLHFVFGSKTFRYLQLDKLYL